MVTVNTSLPTDDANSLESQQRWIADIHQRYSAEESLLIQKAYEIAAKAHDGQLRASGEPYIVHVLTVAHILADIGLDAQTIIAAILHDTLEDTTVSFDSIQEVFGETVAKLVDGVTKLAKITHYATQEKFSKENTQAESQRKMLLAMVEDVRVVFIKLADRLHNMRTLQHVAPEKQLRISRETLDIYAPLANRLGIWQIKWELEDLAFRYLEPEQYKSIARSLDEKRKDREDYIQNVIRSLKQELAKVGIEADVTGRPKHLYSIWKKMSRKAVGLNQIFDTRAVRIMVKDIATCYSALGIVHTIWQHIPKEFDDYITTPKGNAYQSLHTAVVGPDRKTLEIQIRTHDMHEHAELGVAAHWRYKEGTKSDTAFEKKIAWLRQILEWRDEESDAGAFIHRFKAEIFEDRVFVLTPKGTIVDLPAGATPLDFAYYVHTDVGHRCRGAKVDGRIVPLTYTLKNGQQIEILTTRHSQPSRDWLNINLGYLKTSRARNKARSWFKQQDFDQNVTAGRSNVEYELSKLGIRQVSHEEVSKRLKFEKLNEFYAAVGRGDISSTQIAGAAQKLVPTQKAEALPTRAKYPVSTDDSDDGIRVQGVGNLLTKMARCCKPAPPDPIVGYITQNAGITIHRYDCVNILSLNQVKKDRLIEVEWGNKKQAQTYPVDILVKAFDRSGLLRDITAVLSNEKVNVIAMHTSTDKNNFQVYMELTLEIREVRELSKLLDKISQLPNVLDARRKV